MLKLSGRLCHTVLSHPHAMFNTKSRQLRSRLQREVITAAEQDRSHASERNKELAQRMRDALAHNKAAYQSLKQDTVLYRQGDLSANALQQRFALALDTEAQGMFLELAELLPSPEQRSQLLQAAQQAGWTGDEGTKSPGAQDDSPLKAAGPGWAPMDRSGVQRAAMGIDADDIASVSTSSQDMVERNGGNSNGNDSELPAGVQEGEPRPLKRSRREHKAEGSEAGGAKGKGVLYWLRQDFRLHDNPALSAAALAAKKQGGKVTFVYIASLDEDGDDPETGTSWRPGGACLVWIEEALKSMDRDLQQRYGPGAAILYRRGAYLDELQAVACATSSGAVYYNRRYEPAMEATDARVTSQLQEAGYEVRSYSGLLLREPSEIRLDMGSGRWVGHFGTLSPFLKVFDKLGALPKPLPTPQSLPVADKLPAVPDSLPNVADIQLVQLPQRSSGEVIDWSAPLRDAWDISESGALNIMEQFLSEGLKEYEAGRHLADARAVTRLSAYVHHGQLSVRLLHAETAKRGGKTLSKTFSRRIIWRDLAYWQLHHWPHMAAKPIRQHYKGQGWREDAGMLRAWHKGRTGYPLVDAGMRQLWLTGWMQQSIRMVCAAFLTEYLNIHWIHGERWFHDTLVDGDLAINSMMWQNAGKSGLDQWNFTLLPTSTSQDPDGSYIARWVPELAKLPKKYLHMPWKAPEDTRKAAGVTFGSKEGQYPHRITAEVMQDLRRKNAESIAEVRSRGQDWIDEGGYDVVTVPEGSTTKLDGAKMRIFTKSDYRKLRDTA